MYHQIVSISESTDSWETQASSERTNKGDDVAVDIDETTGLVTKTTPQDFAFLHEMNVSEAIHTQLDPKLRKFFMKCVAVDHAKNQVVSKLVPGKSVTTWLAYDKPSKDLRVSIIRQTCFATALVYDQVEFTHWDLHGGNVLIIPTDLEEQVFEFEGEIFRVKTHGLQPVVIDYGLSHVKGESRLWSGMYFTHLGLLCSEADPCADMKMFLSAFDIDLEDKGWNFDLFESGRIKTVKSADLLGDVLNLFEDECPSEGLFTYEEPCFFRTAELLTTLVSLPLPKTQTKKRSKDYLVTKQIFNKFHKKTIEEFKAAVFEADPLIFGQIRRIITNLAIKNVKKIQKVRLGEERSDLFEIILKDPREI